MAHWHGGKPQPRRLCVRWRPRPPSQKGGTAPSPILVHGQVSIIFVVSVGLSVCLFVQFFSAVFDPISIKLGYMLYVSV